VDFQHWFERKEDSIHVVLLQIVSQSSASVGGLDDCLGSRRTLVDARHEKRGQLVWMEGEHPVEVILRSKLDRERMREGFSARGREVG
jgi:chloramphenicol 3-O-phosphotransferase